MTLTIAEEKDMDSLIAGFKTDITNIENFLIDTDHDLALAVCHIMEYLVLKEKRDEK